LNRRLTIAPRVSVGANTLTNPPGQALSASRITQRTEATARLSGQVAHLADTALQVADGAVSQPMTVADLALSIRHVGAEKQASGNGPDPTGDQAPNSVSEVGALVGFAFAGVDTALAVYSLTKAVKARDQASQELARLQDHAAAFDDTLQTCAATAETLASARADLDLAAPVQAQLEAEIESWKQGLIQLESEYRTLAKEDSRIVRLQDRPTRLADLRKGIESLRNKLQNPEKSFLSERRQQIAGHADPATLARSLDAFERRAALKVQVPTLNAQQQNLTDELRGLASSARSHAMARHAHAEARRDTAETATSVTRAGAGLVRSALDATHAGITLAGGTAGSGLVAATHIAGTAAGGLSIVAGGATIGIAAYRMNKASQRREAIQSAIAPANNQPNSEVIQRARGHALERRSTQISTSKWNIFKGVLGVVGGSLAIAAIAATGVGALALGIAALGIGVVSAGTSIGTLYYGYRRDKADAALRAEVATEQTRAETIDAYKDLERNKPVPPGEAPPSEEIITQRAHQALLQRNPHYAIHIFVESLARADSDPDRQAALQFLEDTGLRGAGFEQVRLLATEGASEEARQLLKKSVELHLFG